ncbi:Nn.00g049790.m01.CDS01 [Neocucurbitaria sp. VM-36]
MADLSIITSPGFLAEDNGPSVIATASLMVILCTLFVGMRYYARYLTSTSFNIEDVIIPFAWLAEIGLCVVGIVMVEKAGTGRHMAFVLSTDPAKIPEHFKGIMIQEVLHPAAVAFPKLAVVLLYLHILTNKYERFVAKTLIFVIFATWASFTVAAMFQCMPIAFNWDKTIPGGRCFNVQFFANSSSVPNIATDLAVLVLPLRTVWGLKISVGRRVGLLLIFLTGSVGIIASIIRTIVFAGTLATAGPLTDVTYKHVALINWTILEPGMYLLSTCALSYKPLFRMFAKALHLQAFITHTKSTFGGTRSYVKKTSASTQTNAYHMNNIRNAGVGKFHRLSEDRASDNTVHKRIEVLVTRTIQMASEARTSEDGDWKGIDAESGPYGHGVGTAV